MGLGEEIRSLRQEFGMSQGDLARRLGGGITAQSVSGWERNKNRPSTQNLLEIARVFGRRVEQIMGDDKITPQPEAHKPGPSLLAVAIIETLLIAGVSAEAAEEIAEVVELAVGNLRVPAGTSPRDAIRRIIRWEVSEILARPRDP